MYDILHPKPLIAYGYELCYLEHPALNSGTEKMQTHFERDVTLFRMPQPSHVDFSQHAAAAGRFDASPV